MTKQRTPTKKAASPAKKAASDKRGQALARAIEARATELRLTQKLVAKKLGFSEPYYALLLSGQRWFGSVSEDKLQKIGEFLDVPLISVYMLAEVIHPADFFRPASIESDVEFAFNAMSKDKRFVVAMPPRRDWDAAPLSVKLLCAILYQDVSGKDLLEKAKLIQVQEPGESE